MSWVVLIQGDYMDFIQLDVSTALDDSIKSLSAKDKILICGSVEEKKHLLENYNHYDESPEEIIKESLNIDASSWFSEMRTTMEKEWGTDTLKFEGEWLGEAPSREEFI